MVIALSQILDKAIRRVGLAPQSLTPELVQNAQEDLYLLLLSLSSRGLNLWCLDQVFIPLQSITATYSLPVGTQNLLNVMFSPGTVLSLGKTVSYGNTSVSDDYYPGQWVKVTLAEAQVLDQVGVKFPGTECTSFKVQGSNDGITWTTLREVSGNYQPTRYNWFETPNETAYLEYRKIFPTSLASYGVSDFDLVSGTRRDLTLTQLNHDDYMQLPNKFSQSLTPTSYYFEKLINPQVTVWPIPPQNQGYLTILRSRQVQDVGSLTQELEIPARWIESIVWQLALRLAFELPGVDPARRAELASTANSMVLEVEGDETDHAPIYLAPNIRGYTA